MSVSRLLRREELARRARSALHSAVPASWKALPGLTEAVRPDHWAIPVQPGLEGVHNLWSVAPGLYRAGQPTRQGFAGLADFGVVTVISLRQTVSDTPLAAGTGLILQRIPIKSRLVGESRGERLVHAMRALRKGMEAGPVLVHCHHGADRTGAIIALWRMLYDGWSRQQALDELVLGGFGYHPVWVNIPRYLARADLRDLRARIEARTGDPSPRRPRLFGPAA